MLDPRDYPISCSQWEHLINEYIFSERDRAIVKRTMLDDISYEKVAEEFGLSDRSICNIMARAEKQLLKFIKLA